ncbi:MAG: putative metal-binding motif-containing protein [Myxococcales bacterium]|nr:putative metal-binding motif-containing protein [Myxococcales bacterium]
MIVCLAALAAMGACGGDDPVTKPVGAGCLLPTDCTDPLVCVFQRCHEQCLSDRDCPTGTLCTGAVAPRKGVCLLSDETECNRTSDCQSPLVCGRRLKCEAACKDSRDCLASQACDRGSCVDQTVAPEAGTPLTPGKSGDTCVRTSDCDAPLVCLGGRCTVECITARDCRSDELCDPQGNCRKATTTDAGVDGATDGTSDGATDAATDGPLDGASDAPKDGPTCIADGDCDDGVFCNGAERCVAGACVAAVEGPCVSHVGCVIDGCSESTKKCTHTPDPGKAIDFDKDGYVSAECGGPDCDDKDPNVFPGAPELCDGKDNNCDGKIDNGAVLVRGKAWTNNPDTSYGPRVSARLGTLDGKTLLLTDTSATSSTISYRVFGETFDVNGKSFGEKSVFTEKTLGYGVQLDDLKSLGTGALLLHRVPTGVRQATLLAADLSVTWSKPISTLESSSLGGGVAWNGTDWVAVYGRYTATVELVFTFIKASDGSIGTLRTLPTADGKGTVKSNSPIKVAAIGSTTAVAYEDANGAQLTLISATGDRIANLKLSVADTGGKLYDMYATPTGFLCVWADTTLRVSIVSTLGVPTGPSVPLSLLGSTSTNFRLGFDGTAAVLAYFDTTVGLARLAYGPTGLGGSFESVYPPWTFSGPFDFLGLSMLTKGQYNLYAFNRSDTGADNLVHGTRIGCAP